ncbi:hypothetical protein RI129_010013 [Pyrocoelia pectoralis]|uniref:SIAH-type domain-containing protein n=1 Tax=Pyrocoelia pectoralis TaxID=417401 RepID=A0AAN7ZJ25_9COLE
MSSNNSSYDLPQDIVNTLLCSICDGYLSCGPVMEANGDLICGRCDTNSTDAVLQVAYEKVMSNFIFPCRFDKQGCEERLLFDSSMEHEKQCKYRILDCPALLKIPCTWKLSACELTAHFEEHHRELISSDGQFSINLSQEARCNLLMIRDGITIIIKYFYNHSQGCLHLKVSYLYSEDELIYYKTQVINGTDCDNSLNLPQQQCDLYESFTVVDSTNPLKLEMQKYLGIFGNPPSLVFKISVFITIPEYSRDDSDEKESSKFPAIVNNLSCTSNPSSCDELLNLEKLYCDFCELILCTTYFYQCKNSVERYCGKCAKGKVGMESCIKITQQNYICCWRGCDFLGDVKTLFSHVRECKFKKWWCPFDSCCGKRVFKYNECDAFIMHLKIHATYCSPNNNIVIELFDKTSSKNDVEKSYFTYVSSAIILFTCTITCKNNWSIRSILPHGITAKIFFTHDHCRLRSKDFTFDKPELVEIKNDCIEFPLCFKQYRQLSAIINVEGNQGGVSVFVT